MTFYEVITFGVHKLLRLASLVTSLNTAFLLSRFSIQPIVWISSTVMSSGPLKKPILQASKSVGGAIKEKL